MMESAVNIEIARSLMKEIMYEAGAVDRWNPEKYPAKWTNKIAKKAGKFFELHPELLTDKVIKTLSLGSDKCDGSFDGLENYEGFEELNKSLNQYFDNI